MATQRELAPVVTGLEQSKRLVTDWLELRAFIRDQIRDQLVAGTDFFTIERVDKKTGEVTKKDSLGKSGAEKLAQITRLRTETNPDRDSMELLGNVGQGIICYRTSAFSRETGEHIADGYGAASTREFGGDVNKTMKMGAKRSYIDGVIRALGLSDMFTQDMEDAPAPQPKKAAAAPQGKGPSREQQQAAKANRAAEKDERQRKDSGAVAPAGIKPASKKLIEKALDMFHEDGTPIVPPHVRFPLVEALDGLSEAKAQDVLKMLTRGIDDGIWPEDKPRETVQQPRRASEAPA